MIPLDYLLSVALLTTPGDPSEAAGAFDHFRSVRPTVQSVAVFWEVLDNREVKYVMNRQEDFASDLKLLRRRWDDLADAPPLSDAMRFPDRALISDLLSFNRSYRQQLEHRQSLELVYGWELREVVAEVDRLYQIWDAARDAPLRVLLRVGAAHGAEEAARRHRRRGVLQRPVCRRTCRCGALRGLTEPQSFSRDLWGSAGACPALPTGRG